jgi:RNA polymerase sigma-70 factor (ECF subfamily)
LEFRTFDDAYVKKLASGDPETEAHFHTYFSQFLSLKMRSRRIDPDTAADIRQETLFRVLKVLRVGNGVSQPERFGAFVNSVCNNVLLELGRREAKMPDSTEDSPEVPDRAMDAERSLITAERKKIVKGILDELPAKDRDILRMVFFEEASREEICARLNVEPGHLRVLLHRAKGRFQAAGAKGGRIISQILMLICNGSSFRVTTG